MLILNKLNSLLENDFWQIKHDFWFLLMTGSFLDVDAGHGAVLEW